jgi:hypothetical protein
MPDLIQFVSNGPEIISTNYWQTKHAQRGLFYLSTNAGCFRLLVPAVQEGAIAEMATAREVIISRGVWPERGRHDALEILFEDDSDSPFALHIVTEQVDRLPDASDRDRPGQPARWKLAVWTEAGKLLELPCRYRLVKKIPCLKPF